MSDLLIKQKREILQTQFALIFANHLQNKLTKQHNPL